jgi:acyl-CoA thioester hydrolase
VDWQPGIHLSEFNPIQPMTFRTTLRVRYAETDQMGVVYYANYFVWCEIGRVEYFRELGYDYKQMEIADDCHLPVVEASCRYRSPARYDDEVVIETRVTAMRSHVIKFGYRLARLTSDGEQLLAEAETVHVSVDKNMRKRSLPEKYTTAIRATMA